MSYTTLPAGVTLKPAIFKAAVPDSQIQDFLTLVKLSKLGSPTYENTQSTEDFGVTSEWMNAAKTRWESGYSWRACEDRINSFPNYTAQVADGDLTHSVHFIGLFSEKTDATPLAFYHGWPGSFLEFLDLLDTLKKKYTPQTLPYHVVVPSLIGYGFSSKPPTDRDWKGEDTARVMNSLMVGLGLSGYIAQGGDIGSYISRISCSTYKECKGMHLNFCPVPNPREEGEGSKLSALEEKQLHRIGDFGNFGNAYAREHGTRPATIGFVLASSPIALLAWIGEKFLEWTDQDPPLDHILDSVTLYWFTESFPSAIYTYRQSQGPKARKVTLHSAPQFYTQKPFGFSYFPWELVPSPRSWIEKTGNLVWFKAHESGGHFAAMEKPAELLEDVEAFIKQIESS